MSVIITKKQIEKWVPEQWDKISKFLGLNLTWNDVLKQMEKQAKKKKLKFIGFSIEVGQKLGWFTLCFEEKGFLHYSLNFNPVNKNKANAKKILTHELVHLYQFLFLYKQRDKLTKIYKEAIADVTANKIENDKEYMKKHFYTDPLVMTLAEELWKMPKKQFIKWAKKPKNKKEYEQLTKEVPKLLAKGNYHKWAIKIQKKQDKKETKK